MNPATTSTDPRSHPGSGDPVILAVWVTNRHGGDEQPVGHRDRQDTHDASPTSRLGETVASSGRMGVRILDAFGRTPIRDPGDTAPPPASLYITNDATRLCALLATGGTDSKKVLAYDDLADLTMAGCRPEMPSGIVRRWDGDAAQDPVSAFAAACAHCLRRLAAMPSAYRSAMESLFESFASRQPQARLFALLSAPERHPDRAEPFSNVFAAHDASGAKRRATVASPAQAIDVQTLSGMLDVGGAFSQALPGYEPRPEQIQMLQAVASAFNDGNHLMVEAGTGVGKSLAYLIPCAAWAQANRTPVVISTHTRNLQSQLLEKDVPLLARVFEDPPRVALIKGRGNYLCLRRLLFLLAQTDGEIDAAEADILAAVCAWAIGSDSGDLDELLTVCPGAVTLFGSLTSNAEECLGMSCRGYRQCLLQRARQRALQADLVVANHALVLSELDHDPVALPPHHQIVLDEAHNLEDAATRYFSIEIHSTRLRILLRRLWHGPRRRPRGLLATLDRQARRGAYGTHRSEPLIESMQTARSLLEPIRGAARDFFECVRALPGLRPGEALRYRKSDRTSPSWLAVTDAASPLSRHLEALAQALDAACDRLADAAASELPLWKDAEHDLRAVATALRAFLADCAFVLMADSETHVFWVQGGGAEKEGGELVAAPLAVGEMLHRLIYAARQSVVFCSATLSVNQSFAFVSARLGIDRVEPERMAVLQVASPFDYARRVRVMTPIFLPEPRESGEYEDALSVLLLSVIQHAEGRTLVLFTSHAMLQTCASALAQPLAQNGIRLLAQGPGVSRDAITREFRRGERSVLFGTHAFWEGVDVVGDALSCVILARLPFPAVGDPLVEARCEKVERDGGDSFRGYMLPLAVIRFRQGFGRLIRHREDRGVVIVADRRLLTKSYGIWFRRGLPCPVSRFMQPEPLIDAMAAFLAPAQDGSPAITPSTPQG